MRLLCTACLILLALGRLPCAAADDLKETSGIDLFPVSVLLDALIEAPADYAYCSVNISGGGDRRYRSDGYQYSYWAASYIFNGLQSWDHIYSPVVFTWVNNPGSVSACFRFYDDRDRWIKSVTKYAYVDQSGFVRYGDPWDYQPRRYGSGCYRSSRWDWDEYESDADYAAANINQPWPKAELNAGVSGKGPWTVVLSTSNNLPDGNIISYEWDLNHDGSFNLNSGRSARLEKTLTKPGKYIFTVKITDLRGYSGTAECTVEVR